MVIWFMGKKRSKKLLKTAPKVNIPQAGAGRRLAAKLKRLGEQPPPEEFIRKLKGKAKKEYILDLVKKIFRL